MKRFIIFYIFILMVSILINNAFAAPVLDQYNTPPTFGFNTTISNQYTAAQSFTVGIPGILDSIELPIYKGPTPPNGTDSLLVDIWSGPPKDSGIPLTSLLINYDLIPDYSPGTYTYFHIDLSSYGLGVSIGDELSIALDVHQGRLDPVPHTFYQWYLNLDTNPYPRGAAYGRIFYNGSGLWVIAENVDLGFKTYVDPVPEPTTILLLGSGLIGLAGYARKRFKK